MRALIKKILVLITVFSGLGCPALADTDAYVNCNRFVVGTTNSDATPLTKYFSFDKDGSIKEAYNSNIRYFNKIMSSDGKKAVQYQMAVDAPDYKSFFSKDPEIQSPDSRKVFINFFLDSNQRVSTVQVSEQDQKDEGHFRGEELSLIYSPDFKCFPQDLHSFDYKVKPKEAKAVPENVWLPDPTFDLQACRDLGAFYARKDNSVASHCQIFLVSQYAGGGPLRSEDLAVNFYSKYGAQLSPQSIVPISRACADPKLNEELGRILEKDARAWGYPNSVVASKLYSECQKNSQIVDEATVAFKTQNVGSFPSPTKPSAADSAK